jgi:AcrR family transcriptional regulator
METENKKEDEKGRSRHQRRVKVTQRKLLDAARAVFAEKGLDLTTIDDITERADVGKGTFYYHFSEKNELIAKLIDEIMRDLVQVIEQKCEGVTDLATLLDTIVGVHIDFFSNRWEDFVLYFHGRADLQLQEGYSGIEKPFMRYLEKLEDMIDSVIASRLPKPLLSRFGYAVAGFISGYYSFAVIATEGDELDRSFHGIKDAFVASLVRFIKEATSATQPPAPPSSTKTKKKAPRRSGAQQT